jgi:hypothetical protein
MEHKTNLHVVYFSVFAEDFGREHKMTNRSKSKYLLGFIIIPSLAVALSSNHNDGAKPSQVHKIPFGSSGNSIELSIVNGSPMISNNINVNAGEIPSWMHFKTSEQIIPTIKPQATEIVTFIFAVDKSAPVNKEQLVTFNISTPLGETWTKELTLSITPPEQFELFQNYPNPFNPATTISYQLPKDAKVRLKIYNMLGQEIATLVDENRSSGYHEEVWNPTGVASGIFVYELSFIDQQNHRVLARKKMMQLK